MSNSQKCKQTMENSVFLYIKTMALINLMWNGLYKITSKLLILILSSTLPFIFSLNGDFVFDDSEAILKNKDVTEHSFINSFSSDFWGSDILSNVSHKSYRPLTVITFRLNYIVAGNVLNPLQFKVTNLCCHIICSILVWYSYKAMMCGVHFHKKKSLRESTDLSFLGAILFSVHPIHTEAVSGIVGRADILAAIAYFSSFLFYHYAIISDRRSTKRMWFNLIMCLIMAFISMLFKENGITVLGFCFIYELVVNLINVTNKWRSLSKRTYIFARIVIILLSVVLFLRLRWSIMGKAVPQFKAIDNPAAFSNDFFTKAATYNYLYFLNMLLFIWPQWLCFDWSMNCVPLLKELNDYRISFILLFYFYIIVVFCYLVKRNNDVVKRRLVFLSCMTIAVPFLPASNLFLTVGFVLAERILYIPSAGYCLLFAIGYDNIVRKFKLQKIGPFLYTFLTLLYGLRSAQRSFQWQNELELFTSGLHVCPLNAKVHYNVAKVADGNNYTQWALHEYREAISLYPEYYQAMNNLANMLKDRKEYTEAEKYLKMALQYKNDFSAAWMNLGIVYASTKRYEEAEKAYLTAIKHRTKHSDSYYNLGNLYLEMKMNDKAISHWKEAIRYNPKHVLSWSNLLALLDNTGQTSKALEIIPIALNELPQAPSMHFVAANIFGKIGQCDNAEHHFKISIQLFGNRVQAIHHSNFGVLYHRCKKYTLAEEQYIKALKIDPNFSSALNNIKSLKKKLKVLK